MANNRPEKQHIITEAYQKNFVNTEDKIFVCDDLQEAKWRPSQPHNEFKEKNFQTLFQFIGLDPFFLEKEIGKIESDAIHEIKNIINNKRLPDNEKQLGNIINLMGILGIRNPVKRAILEKLHQHRPKAILQVCAKDESTYNIIMNQMKSDGIIKKIVPYEKARQAIIEEKIMLQVEQDKINLEMLSLSEYLIDLLAQRNWSIVEAKDSEFVSSNHPLNIINTDDSTHEPYFEFKNNIVTFPLSSQLALIGSFSKLPVYQLIPKSLVEGINSCTTYHGSTKLFASKETPLPSKSAILELKNFHKKFAA
jgi:hypothetical protein